MNIEEIKKALNEAGVDAAVVSAVEGLDSSAEVERLTSELNAEKGKSAQFLTDKKGLREKVEALERERDELKNSNLSVDERLQKQIDDLKGTIAERDKAIEAEKSAHAAEKREAEILKIAGGLKAANGVGASVLNTLVKTQLADVDDLSDGDAVTAKINDLKENNKGLFAADVPAGEGGKHNGGGGNQDEPATIKGAVASAWNQNK